MRNTSAFARPIRQGAFQLVACPLVPPRVPLVGPVLGFVRIPRALDCMAPWPGTRQDTMCGALPLGHLWLALEQ
jgi:hypothetical protein